MNLTLAFATIMLMSPSLKLSRGAFVGAFDVNGQSITVTMPLGENWISSEQVQREILFRRWKAPLTSAQMAELAKGLEADFAADILFRVFKTRRGYRLLAFLRCISASFGTIVHLGQEQASLSSLDNLSQTIDKVIQSLLSRIPTQIPLATVQLKEGERRIHMIASVGDWKRGAKLIFLRLTRGQIILLGEGQIVMASLLAGGNKWILEADLTEVKDTVRPGDKALQVFKLPKMFAKWQ